MNNFIEKFQKLIISSHKKITILNDEDDLFNYPEFSESIEDEKYILIDVKTNLDLRILFETEIRNSDNRYLIKVPLHYKPIPDIELLSHQTTISLNDLIPNLESSVIKGLSFEILNLLYNIKLYEKLDAEHTVKFVLENVYNLDFDTLIQSKSKERILNALITVFLGKNNVNSALANHLTILAKSYFPHLTKSSIDKCKLQEFIRNAWSKFIYENDQTINFEDPILNKNIGFLFLFELLEPIKINSDQYNTTSKSLRVGVFVDENENNDKELENLISYLDNAIQKIDDSYEDWFVLIQLISKAKLKQLKTKNSKLYKECEQLEIKINKRFQNFIENSYWSLFSLSGIKKPVLVTRILEFIKVQQYQKKALLVIDGMNYWQATLLKDRLKQKGISVNLNTTLAYIPTITAWSRQAIFRGLKPDLTEDNSKEELYFKRYWMNNNYSNSQIEFLRLEVNKNSNLQSIHDSVELLGIVSNDLDNIMHGNTLGYKELESSTNQWLKESEIINSIKFLKENNFKIYITTDHGNVLATGVRNIKLSEKVGTPSKSKRHLLFSNSILQSNFLEENKDLNIGVKDNSIYFKGNESFSDIGTKIITHGGSHFWEVLIPFIDIV